MDTTTHNGYTTQAVPNKLQLLFTVREVCALTGMAEGTLSGWIRRKWFTPAKRDHRNRHLMNAFQLIGVAMLHEVTRKLKDENSLVGRVGVERAMDNLAQQDDALLLRDKLKASDFGENKPACALFGVWEEEDLPQSVYETLARCMNAIDRKAGHVRHRIVNRVG